MYSWLHKFHKVPIRHVKVSYIDISVIITVYLLEM